MGRRRSRSSCGLTNKRNINLQYITAANVLPLERPSAREEYSQTRLKYNQVIKGDDLNQIEDSIDMFDIDGDGQIDPREMKLAQNLHKHPFLQKYKNSQGNMSLEEKANLHRLAGRHVMAEEFVTRNKGKLWKYGGFFNNKSDQESIESIAKHRNFKSFMESLETMERKKNMRSSSGIRNSLQGREDAIFTANQTWVDTPRKYIVTNPNCENDNVQSGKNKSKPNCDTNSANGPMKPQIYDLSKEEKAVMTNKFGVVDVDGDGVIDADEMKIHLRIQQEMKKDESKEQQQIQGRSLMAKDFVETHEKDMWKFSHSYFGKSKEEMINMLTYHNHFAMEMNRLKAKARVFTLKASHNVQKCLVDPSKPTYRVVSPEILTSRPVHCRSELFVARTEMKKNAMSSKFLTYDTPSANGGLCNSDIKQNHFMRRQSSGLLAKRRPSSIHLKQRILGHCSSAPQIGLATVHSIPQPLEMNTNFRITK